MSGSMAVSPSSAGDPAAAATAAAAVGDSADDADDDDKGEKGRRGLIIGGWPSGSTMAKEGGGMSRCCFASRLSTRDESFSRSSSWRGSVREERGFSISEACLSVGYLRRAASIITYHAPRRSEQLPLGALFIVDHCRRPRTRHRSQ